VVEHVPYERCFANYDSKDSFFFLDPPYLDAPTGAYDGWDKEQMRGLRKNISKLKGRWLLTVNDSPMTRELFSDCQIQAVSTQSRLCNNRTHSDVRFGELLITT
jgi:DNA adenine methylase